MKAVLTLLGVLLASAVGATPIVNIKSMSPAGDRAIMTFDRIWAEVDLTLDGGLRSIRPPQGCAWTSMAYAHDTDDIAMVAYCVAEQRVCEQGTSILLIAKSDQPPLQVAERQGARWSDAVWRVGGKRVHLIETAITRPVAMGLDDLNANVRRCGWSDEVMKVVDIGSGATIALDVLPQEWMPRNVIIASDVALTATVAARDGVADGSPAAIAIAEVCADPTGRGRNLSAVCKPSGYDLVMTWTDGEWVLGAGDWTGAEAFHGRAIAAPYGDTLGREDCKIVPKSGSYSLNCTLTVNRRGRISEISAPNGLFGDLALSGDGRLLAAVTAGRSFRYRRFDIWDLETGVARSLDPILLPSSHYPVWPPE